MVYGQEFNWHGSWSIVVIHKILRSLMGFVLSIVTALTRRLVAGKSGARNLAVMYMRVFERSLKLTILKIATGEEKR